MVRKGADKIKLEVKMVIGRVHCAGLCRWPESRRSGDAGLPFGNIKYVKKILVNIEKKLIFVVA